VINNPTFLKIMTVPTASDIQNAHERIRPYIHRTPVLTNQAVDLLIGSQVFFKPENFQKIGAFKARGALNAILSLEENKIKNGIVAHSSGNHAQGVAYACKTLGIPAFIVMPEDSSRVKIDAVKSYGAAITFCINTPEERQKKADEIIEKTGAAFVHPYNDYQVIAGQATAAKELIEDLTEPLDFIICPVGGGGLLSGTALSAHYFSPKTHVIAAEPEGAADAILSFQNEKITKAPYVNTIADGLLTTLGDKTFPLILQYVTDIVTVTDEDIVAAMRLYWERMKIVVAPSGAVSLAALLRYKGNFSGKKVGIVISGGNVDLNNLPFAKL